MKLDILALAAHPDDVELCCSGTLVNQVRLGNKVGVVDFTRGEMGTRGTPEIRMEEATRASEIMGLTVRDNLGFKDGTFPEDEAHLRKIIEVIRKYRPDVLLINAKDDRHPDHPKSFNLSKKASFISGLRNFETEFDGVSQEPWRPKVVYSYIQGWFLTPDIVVDVSDSWEVKMDAIKAYKSQFHDPDSKDPETWLSSPEFFDLIKGRASEFGQAIGAKYGEGFQTLRWPGVKNLFDLA